MNLLTKKDVINRLTTASAGFTSDSAKVIKKLKSMIIDNEVFITPDWMGPHPRDCAKWSEDEDILVLALFQTMHPNQIAEKVGRKPSAIKGMLKMHYGTDDYVQRMITHLHLNQAPDHLTGECPVGDIHRRLKDIPRQAIEEYLELTKDWGT